MRSDTTNKRPRERVADVRAERDALLNELADLNHEYEFLSAECDEVRRERDEARDERDAHECEVETLRAEVERARWLQKQLEASGVYWFHETERLERELDDLKTAMPSMVVIALSTREASLGGGRRGT